MSNEEKNNSGFTSVLNKFRSLSRNKKILVAVSLCLVASLISLVGAALITGTSIFGPPTTGPQSNPVPTATPTPTPTPTPTSTPTPVYGGAIGSVTWTDVNQHGVSNPSPITTGTTLTLSTPLTPSPLKSQDVWFYYSLTPISVDNNGIPTKPNQLIGIDIAHVSAGATYASVQFQVPQDGQYYFIAEIPTPD